MKISNSIGMSLIAFSLFTMAIACDPGKAIYDPSAAPSPVYPGSYPYINGNTPTLKLQAVPQGTTLQAPNTVSDSSQIPVYLSVKVNPGEYGGFHYSGSGTGALNVGSTSAGSYGILNGYNYAGDSSSQMVMTYLPAGSTGVSSHSVEGTFTVQSNGGDYYYDVIGNGNQGGHPASITVDKTSTTPVTGTLNLLPC